MMVKTDLRGLKGMSPKIKAVTSTPSFTYSPVWLPVQTEGNAVVKVTTRQEYLSGQLGDWRTIQLTRVATIIFGIAALYFLSVNIFVSAALGVLAGWTWGVYTKKAFFFETVNRKREILEGT